MFWIWGSGNRFLYRFLRVQSVAGIQASKLNEPMDNIVVIGSSGHAKVVIDILENEGRYKIVGLLDRYRKIGDQTLGYPVLGKEEDLVELVDKHELKGGIIAIGDNFSRGAVAARVREACQGFPFVSAIHPRASIATEVAIGEGTVVMAGVTINRCCSVGSFCILNTNSSLDHDSVMESFSSLAPGVTTGGECRIGTYSAVGLGSSVIHRIHVGEHSVIGAGSTVLHNVDSFKVAYGTPARMIRDRSAGDKYL